MTFCGGPLDGVCWPCIVNPNVLALRTVDGRLHLYECDLEEQRPDGSVDYRMVPAQVPEDAWEELIKGGLRGQS